MGVMPQPGEKGPLLETLDRFFVPSNDVALKKLRDDLDKSNGRYLLDKIKDNGVLDRSQVAYLRTEWFPRWPSPIAFQDRIRVGLIEAADLILQMPHTDPARRGLDAYWVCQGGVQVPRVRVYPPHDHVGVVVFYILTQRP